MDSNIMERKSRLTSMKICRFCLNEDDNLLRSLYDKTKLPKRPAQTNLPLQIQTCIAVEVFPSDKQPGYICENCRVFMDLFYKFKLICRQADEAILQFIQHGTELVPISWPAKLIKLVNHPPTSPRKSDKTATALDFDEDLSGGNVYNIKIGDGPDDDSKEETCIKVVKSGDKISISKETESPKAKGSPQVRPYICKPCDKSFLKFSLYSKHVRAKHSDSEQSVKFPQDGFTCDLCPATFPSQDELIYHSAQHATQNLTCPLCHEKFQKVEEVSQHIKSHVDGEEFLCDLCELVFTHKEKLERHVQQSHADDADDAASARSPDQADEDESMENEEDDEDLFVKEVDGQMVVEVKKPGNFIKEDSISVNRSNESAGSEEETHASISKVPKIVPKKDPKTKSTSVEAKQVVQAPVKKPELVKPMEVHASPAATKEPVKTEKATVGGASDKSLRLLEKELQELQRTNNNTEASKPPVKIPDMFRGRKSAPATPRPRVAEERKAQKAVSDKKPRAPPKENLEPRERDKPAAAHEDEPAPKEEAKNGASERPGPGADSVRRSHRTSKVNNYATVKRIGYSSPDSKKDDDEQEQEEAEEQKRKPVTSAKKRKGRPRKPVVVPEKKKKLDDKDMSPDSVVAEKTLDSSTPNEIETPSKAADASDVIRSPSGQTLKKVPIKALPPGVKPMPLPSPRPGASGEVCKMQIGQKMVKVQKIVMTKAEVEAMKKKGLLEVKDGTMVLKQGIKLPTADSAALKSTLVGETASNEASTRKEKAAPTRCDVDE